MLAIYSARRILAAPAMRLVAAAASTLLLTSAITFIQPATSAVAADCATSTTSFVGDGTNDTVNGATYNLAAIKSGSNCTWTTPDGIRAVSFLTIGGGGGGASRHGGGGSAGEYLVTSRTVDVAAQITVSVGVGGAGGASSSASQGLAGEATTVSGAGALITARPGDGGRWHDLSAGAGKSGNQFSSGVGGADRACTGVDSKWCGGGGAGATANGENYVAGQRAGNGGAGADTVFYPAAAASTLAVPTAFGGGGGGGAEGGGTAGTATHGGGAGSVGYTMDATSGALYSGGGGGGSGYQNNGGLQSTGGSGGSGLVVVRWASVTSALPTISGQPTDVYTGTGGAAAFTAAATNGGSGTLKYQWQTSSDSGATWVAEGAESTTATLNLTSVQPATPARQYRVEVRNYDSLGNFSSVLSAAAKLRVSASTLNSVSFTPSTIASGGSWSFLVNGQAAGSPVTFYGCFGDFYNGVGSTTFGSGSWAGATGSSSNTLSVDKVWQRKLWFNRDANGEVSNSTPSAAQCNTISAASADLTATLTIQPVVLGGSVLFNGTNQELTVPASTDFNIGTGDFTVEWFQYQTANTTDGRFVFSLGPSSYPDLGFEMSNGSAFAYAEGSIIASKYLNPEAYFHKWVHFALTRSSGVNNLFIDGVRVASNDSPPSGIRNIQTDSNILHIGSAGTNFFPGIISNFHLVNGTALYTGTSLAVPTGPIAAVSNTKLLLNFTNQASLLTDSSTTPKTLTNVGASYNTATPFRLVTPSAPTLNSATGVVSGGRLSVSIPIYNGGSSITGYQFQVNGGSWVTATSINPSLPNTASGHTISVANLTYGTSYSVVVRAVSGEGVGAQSNSLTFTPKLEQTVTWAEIPVASLGDGPITPTAATTDGNGAISYEVASPGSTGCAIDSSTGVLTYSAIGSCLVVARAAETEGYVAGAKLHWFTVGKLARPISWSPTLALSVADSPATPTATASAAGSPTLTFSVTSAGTTGCTVNSVSGVLSFTAAGDCAVRVSADSDATYQAATRDVVFVIAPLAAYTVTYNYHNATSLNLAASDIFTIGGSGLVLPTPVRTSFVFQGWFTASTGGTLIGLGGAPYTPAADTTLHAQWVQSSLWGIGAATKIGTIITVNGVGSGLLATANGTSVSFAYQANTFAARTVIDVYLLGNTDRANRLITESDDFAVNLVVSWLAEDGTVPNTAAGKPLVLTITNSAIRSGAKIYALLENTVTLLGVATQDGTAVVSITEDPEIVVVNMPATVSTQAPVVPTTPMPPVTQPTKPVAPKPTATMIPMAQAVMNVLPTGVPRLVGTVASKPITFGPDSAKLAAANLKTLKELVANYSGKKGSMILTGFVKFTGRSLAVDRKLAVARAKAVAGALLKLGIDVRLGFVGYGPRTKVAPTSGDRRVELRWVPSS